MPGISGPGNTLVTKKGLETPTFKQPIVSGSDGSAVVSFHPGFATRPEHFYTFTQSSLGEELNPLGRVTSEWAEWDVPLFIFWFFLISHSCIGQ